MSSQPMAMHHSSTVPIGGAPFVHPTFDLTYSPSGSSSGSSSPTSSFSSSPPAREAALAYSRMLHQHTSSMWQNERQNIERSRLEKTSAPTSPSSTKTKSPGYIRDSTQSTSSAAPAVPPKAAQPKSSALDVLLGRSRSKKEKGSTSMDGASGHRRGKSLS